MTTKGLDLTENAPVRTAPNAPNAVTETLARPKVMRRPAQFSKIPSASSRLPTPNLALPEVMPVLPPTRAWQDDGRFAITLLCIIILTNIIITAWLSHVKPATITPPPTVSGPISGTVTPDSAASVHILNESAQTESDQ